MQTQCQARSIERNTLSDETRQQSDEMWSDGLKWHQVKHQDECHEPVDTIIYSTFFPVHAWNWWQQILLWENIPLHTELPPVALDYSVNLHLFWVHTFSQLRRWFIVEPTRDNKESAYITGGMFPIVLKISNLTALKYHYCRKNASKLLAVGEQTVLKLLNASFSFSWYWKFDWRLNFILKYTEKNWFYVEGILLLMLKIFFL